MNRRRLTFGVVVVLLFGIVGVAGLFGLFQYLR